MTAQEELRIRELLRESASQERAETPARIEAALVSAVRRRRNVRVLGACLALAASAAVLLLTVWISPKKDNPQTAVIGGGQSAASVQYGVSGATAGLPATTNSPGKARGGSPVAAKGLRGTGRDGVAAQTTAGRALAGRDGMAASPPRTAAQRASNRMTAGSAGRATLAARRAAEADEVFIAVGAWQAIEPMERGSIFRVRLPKSSLPGLGIPVSADRWHESVPADVVLGEDGLVRAVRLVSSKQ